MTAEKARLLTTLLSLAEDTGSLSDELHFAGWDATERVALDHGAANVLRALVLPKAARVLEVGAGFGALTRYLGEVSATVHAVEADPVRAAAVRFRTRDLGTVTVHDRLVIETYDFVVVQQPYATRNLLDWVRERLSPTGAVVVLTSSRGVVRTLAAAGLEVQRELLCSPGHEVARAVRGAQIDTELPRLSAAISGGPANGLALLSGPGAASLWPAYRLATYFNTAERAAFACTRADVVRTGEGAEVRRAPLVPSPPVAGISVGPCADKVYDAPTMVEVLLDEPERVAELLTGWRDLVRSEAASGVEALWDLVPHNVLVDGATLRPIDLEWRNAGAGVSEVVERGVLVLADKLADACWSAAAEGGTVRDLAGWLGVLIGLHPSFVDSAMAREVAFSAIGSCGTAHGTDEVRASIDGIWRKRLARTVHRYRSTKVGAGVAANEDEVAKR
ncbi:methyltransferase [Amycolatopsis umgeniensis]|uniref:Precorrin-6B methylase 2 n=1 Tax=Amycolatopsis umgeniensis TaxID=336628 RepID=A0A841B6S2_9PSEU|nr:methyltransferase [Amycolatopsis umgeniensis]MBB5854228.1 precorrin-6B methylase 2 [Amycolatopsis umgeniensis]